MPSKPAFSITAVARYGLQEGSVAQLQAVSSPLLSGMRMRATVPERPAICTGASYPGTSLL